MGVTAIKWRCPKCNIDVGGSMGELKNHVKRIHKSTAHIQVETRIATTA
jgi:hypothetical protein